MNGPAANDDGKLRTPRRRVRPCLVLEDPVRIRRRRPRMHMLAMLAALFTSAVFLCSYLYYHWAVGSVPYPRQDWTRWLYFAVLIPHAILATVMVPFILLSLWHAFRKQFARHARITRWIWPVWMYVSVSGVVVYTMLYRL